MLRSGTARRICIGVLIQPRIADVIAMRMTDQDRMHISEAGVSAARHCGSWIVKDSNPSRVFKEKGSVLGTKLASLLAYRRDFDGLRLSD